MPELPPIDAGSEWEDGIAQVQIREHTPEGRTLSVTAEDMRRRAADGEIRRVG